MGMRPHTFVPWPGAKRTSRSRRSRQAGPPCSGGPCRTGSRPRRTHAVVGDREEQVACCSRGDARWRGRVRVLRDVLHRLQHGEVHGRLDVGGVAAHPVGVDGDRDGRLAWPGRGGPRAARGRPAGAGRCPAPGRGGCPRVLRVAEDVLERLVLGLRVRPTSRSAMRTFTASATSCCWAPSWMLRSRRRRSSSCAATSRKPRRAQVLDQSEVLETRPACAARSCSSLSSSGRMDRSAPSSR